VAFYVSVIPLVTTSFGILPIYSADDIASAPEEESDYVVDQIVIREAITAFAGTIKGGKSTAVGALLKCMLNGNDFIGLKTRSAKILYCTEEGRKSFRKLLARTGLSLTDGRLRVMFLGEVKSIPWPQIVLNVLNYCEREGIEVVIFDTLTRWAKIKADQENDAGAAAAAMEPLESLRAARMAVLALFHDRKSGGSGPTDSLRGSSAFGGAADILFSIHNPHTNGHPNRRVLQSIGRFDDPGTWIIDWDSDEQAYTVASEGGADGVAGMRVERNSMKSRVIDQLGVMPMTRPDLELCLGVKSGNNTLGRALQELQRDNFISVSGGSGRGPGQARIYEVIHSAS
jgi:hypothetical protein